MKRRARSALGLRQTIDRMPIDTRHAMLRAVELGPIIVGAYTDGQGGVCPMLAAHRNGGRTSFASFASAWDRYTRAGGTSRPATERELRTLRTMLEASIAAEGAKETGGDLGAAIAEHRASREAEQRPRASARRTAQPRQGTGERDRTSELAARPGWAWLRPFRRLDEYERFVGELAGAVESRRPQGVTRGERPAPHDAPARGELR